MSLLGVGDEQTAANALNVDGSYGADNGQKQQRNR